MVELGNWQSFVQLVAKCKEGSRAATKEEASTVASVSVTQSLET